MPSTAQPAGGTDKPAPSLVKVVAAPPIGDMALLALLIRIFLLAPIALFMAALCWGVIAAVIGIGLAILGFSVDSLATSGGR